MLIAGLQGLRARAQVGTLSRGGHTTISGTVRDARTRRLLPAVHVTVPRTGVGTVTNADGFFTIHVDDSLRADRLEFSHIGYALYEYTLRPEAGDVARADIRLTPNANVLQEVMVMGGDATDLVREAADRVTDNYPTRPNRLTGFYREVIRKGRRYIDISEAVVSLYKTSYNGSGTDGDRVRLEKGRRLLSQRAGDTLIVKFEGGPTLSIYLDVVKNGELMFNREEIDHYAFRYNRTVMIDDRPHVEVRFMPRAVCPYALYEGLLYIDQATRTISRAEFSLDMSDRLKATQAMLRKKPLGLRFRPERLAFLVTYRRQRDGRSRLGYDGCETDVARHDGGEQHPFQIGLKAVRDVARQTRAVVVHGADEAGDAQVGIYRLAQLADGIEQGADAFEGEVFALDRHEDVVGGNQRIDGQQVERRWAVNQHPVETLRPAEDVFFQQGMAHVFAEQRFVRAGEVGVGGHQPDV